MTEFKRSLMDRIANCFRGRRYPAGTHGATKPKGSPIDLAGKSNAYAVVVDGVLEPRTISLTANSAAGCALQGRHNCIVAMCPTDECQCMIESLAKIAPEDRG